MHWLGREWRTNKQLADNPTPSPDRQTSVKDRIHRDILRFESWQTHSRPTPEKSSPEISTPEQKQSPDSGKYKIRNKKTVFPSKNRFIVITSFDFDCF